MTRDLFSAAADAPKKSEPALAAPKKAPGADGQSDALRLDAPADPVDIDLQRRCAVCGADAPFGFGVSLRLGRSGIWTCGQHRDAGRTLKPDAPR